MPFEIVGWTVIVFDPMSIDLPRDEAYSLSLSFHDVQHGQSDAGIWRSGFLLSWSMTVLCPDSSRFAWRRWVCFKSWASSKNSFPSRNLQLNMTR
jgi:hypothetical protein